MKPGSIPGTGAKIKGAGMSQKDTLNKAYGNVPKEVGYNIDFFSFIPFRRPVRYFWLTWIVRKIFR